MMDLFSETTGEAVKLFTEMLTLDVKSDHVVLTALLSSYSHVRLVDFQIGQRDLLS
jgi:hypothetical protein